jgi:hypothetical protein
VKGDEHLSIILTDISLEEIEEALSLSTLMALGMRKAAPELIELIKEIVMLKKFKLEEMKQNV